MEFRNNFENLNKKFSSPQEEIKFLKEQISLKERELNNESDYKVEREKVVDGALREYQNIKPEQLLEKGTVIPEKIREEIVLELSPEEHDQKMSELIGIIEKHGIINTIDIVKKMNDPHILDDFHRFLVQFLKSDYEIKGYKEDSEIARILKRTLYEIILPDYRGGDSSDSKELFNKMEQLYSGMLSIGKGDKSDYLTLEIANSILSKEFIFYVSVSNKNKDLFEKQLLSIFPEAVIKEQKNDFNIFNYEGYSVGAYARLASHGAKPIKTFDDMGTDPLTVMLNSFSKLDRTKEGAAIQIIFKPVDDFYLKNYSKGLKKLEKGEKGIDEFYVKNTFSNKLFNTFSKTVNSINSNTKEGDNEGVDSVLIEQVRKKISTTVVSTNIKLVASSTEEIYAKEIMNEMQSAFNQFKNTSGNEFKFENIEKKHQNTFFKKFSFREFDPEHDVPLNLKELATVIHFPSEQKDLSSQLKTNKAKTAPAPNSIPESGVLIGYNEHQNQKIPIYFSPQDRLRHFYVIGQTGTGKTTILKNMIIQDIQNGDGVCFIDPHGSDVQDILANIPKERYDDLIYFDPAYAARPMALNMLEYDRNYPEQKTFVVNELFSIFQKLYGEANPESMGPMFEQYFRNSTMLVIEDPDTGCTLLDVSRVMADENFRKLKLSRCKNPIVVQFWKEIAEKAGGEASLANIVPYIVSKFDVFLANDIMRPVIAQEKSSFNFREIMDNKKILLVNLSKGRLGDINSSLIGLILVGKILMAALSRVDSFDKGFPPFYLYIDEFQNVTTPSISTILSEARKYKLSLHIAHQFIGQLSQGIKDSVFGNVGSMATYRVGAEDAQFLESQFSPIFESKDIMNIDNFNFYIRLLAEGIPVKPFSLRAYKEPEGDRSIINDLKELSYLKYGGDRDQVEAEIMKKYEKQKPDTLSSFSI
jgi:hypothetical protein